MNHNSKLRLKRYIAESRRTGGAAHVLAESKIDGVISALAHQLSDDFSFAQMEEKLRAEIHAWPSLKVPSVGSQEEADIAAAARAKAGPSREDYAAMGPEQRLEAINAQEQAKRDAKAAQDAKAPTEQDYAKLKAMRPGARLALANSWKGVGVELDELEGAPLTREELKRMSASRRLSVANEEALRASKKDKGE